MAMFEENRAEDMRHQAKKASGGFGPMGDSNVDMGGGAGGGAGGGGTANANADARQQRAASRSNSHTDLSASEVEADGRAAQENGRSSTAPADGRRRTRTESHGSERVTDERDARGEYDSRNREAMLGRDFNKRLAKFLLSFRRELMKKAEEKAQTFPVKTRLQMHKSDFAEQVSRRVVQAAFRRHAQGANRARNEHNASFRGAVKGAGHKGDSLFLSLPNFTKMVDEFKGKGIQPMSPNDMRLLWQRADGGKCSKFMDLVFIEDEEGQTAYADVGFENGLSNALRGTRPTTVDIGPFDRSRFGERYVPAPSPAHMPTVLSYRQCRTTVCPPSKFDPTLITRSGKIPNATLEIGRW